MYGAGLVCPTKSCPHWRTCEEGVATLIMSLPNAARPCYGTCMYMCMWVVPWVVLGVCDRYDNIHVGICKHHIALGIPIRPASRV